MEDEKLKEGKWKVGITLSDDGYIYEVIINTRTGRLHRQRVHKDDYPVFKP